MTNEQWREAMARLDGWARHIDSDKQINAWRDAEGLLSWRPLNYDTLEDMLRVCKKQGWWYDLQGVPETGTHLAYIDTNPLGRGGKHENAKADTPQAAIRQAIEKVIGGGDG